MDPDQWIGLSLFLLVFVGYPASLLGPVFGGAFGTPTFNNCATGCSLAPINFIPPDNPFYRLLARGDFIGFIFGWFSSPQMVVSALSIGAGILLLALGLNISMSGTLLASGFSFGIGSQGARLGQAFGIGLLMWGLISNLFTGWFGNLGWGLGTSLYVLIALLYFYGVWGWARSWR